MQTSNPDSCECQDSATKSGWFVSGGVNAGLAEIDGLSDPETVAKFARVSLGYLVNRYAAVVVDGRFGYNQRPYLRADHQLVTVGVQHWLTQRIWIKAGIGVGSVRVQSSLDAMKKTSDLAGGAAALASTGVTLHEQATWSVDAELVASYTHFGSDDRRNSILLGLGVTAF